MAVPLYIKVINLERDLVKLRAALESGAGADASAIEEVWYAVTSIYTSLRKSVVISTLSDE